MFLNELYYNKFYHLLVYFLTCCAQISIISFRVLRDSPEASSYRRRKKCCISAKCYSPATHKYYNSRIIALCGHTHVLVLQGEV